MIWILIGVVLVGGSVALAHRALREWWPGDRPVVSTALGLAAFVVITYVDTLDNRDKETLKDLDEFVSHQEISV